MKKFGFNYGPRFHGLRDITASITEKRATARVDDFVDVDNLESPYTMHPCTIDCIFQLFSVAQCQGIPRLFDHLAVPTSIEELCLLFQLQYIRSSIRPPNAERRFLR